MPKLTVGQKLTHTEAAVINKEFVNALLEGEMVWTDPVDIKKGTMLLLNKARWSDTPEFVVVKVTQAKNVNSDYEVIRVTDTEYSWRISGDYAVIN